jgi:hypothetical protein
MQTMVAWRMVLSLYRMTAATTLHSHWLWDSTFAPNKCY